MSAAVLPDEIRQRRFFTVREQHFSVNMQNSLDALAGLRYHISVKSRLLGFEDDYLINFG